MKNYVLAVMLIFVWVLGLVYLNIGPVIHLLIFIAMITVGFQAVKSAIANPVKSLRTE